ncbi:hypothetical protein AgCh_030122 [Apium graveolens]
MGNTQQRATQTQENLEENDQENGSIMTCEICIEPICLPSKKFKNQEKCAHPFCEECVIKYIEVKIDERVCEIKCPALNCVHFLDPFSVRPLIAPNVFDKWCDLLCENAVLGFERCYCPYRDCSVLIVNECGGCVKQSKCPKCGKMFCFSCKIAWHAGYRCEEGRELRDRNDVAFGMLAERRKWKRCPVCLHFVELVSGCSIVKCSKNITQDRLRSDLPRCKKYIEEFSRSYSSHESSGSFDIAPQRSKDFWSSTIKHLVKRSPGQVSTSAR